MQLPRWLRIRRRRHQECPECGSSVTQTYCDVCGYDLVRKTKAAKPQPPTT